MVATVENNSETIELGMRMGLGPLVTELQRRIDSRVDVVADTRQMSVKVSDGRYMLCADSGTSLMEWMDSAGMEIERHAVGQLLEKFDVPMPKVFADRLAIKHPDDAAALATKLLKASSTTRMVRMLDGRVRAFLSANYRPLDNFDLAATALRVARDAGADVLECFLTPSKMEIKLVQKSVWDSVDAAQREGGYGSAGNHTWIRTTGVADKAGEDLPGGSGTIHPLVVVGNSETGEGSYYVRLGVLQAICCNSAIIERAMGAVHLGGKQLEGVLSAETLRLESRAIHSKAADVIAASFKEEQFRKMCGIMQAAAEMPIARPRDAFDALVGGGLLTESQRNDVFAYFLKDYQPTALGVASAMTRKAQDVPAAEAMDLESAAGQLIKNPRMLAAAV